MRRECAVAAVILLCQLCGLWTLEGQERGSRYVVFWNLENYFDPFDDSLTVDEEFTPAGEKHWTWKKFLVKRNLIAKVLLSMYDRYGDWPLAVGFAEVENRMVLRQLTEQTPLAKLGYGVVHRESPDSRGIDVGFIYREEYLTVHDVEALEVLTGRERPTRDILHILAVLHLPDESPESVHFYINHWPSKFGGEEYSRPFRQSAADTLSWVLGALADSAAGALPPVIVTGDFNDTPDSEPVMSVQRRTGLLNPALDLHQRGEGTLKYNGRWELIDLFMMSPALSGAQMEIYRHPLLLEEDEKF